jgi:hypothetical protein
MENMFLLAKRSALEVWFSTFKCLNHFSDISYIWYPPPIQLLTDCKMCGLPKKITEQLNPKSHKKAGHVVFQKESKISFFRISHSLQY